MSPAEWDGDAEREQASGAESKQPERHEPFAERTAPQEFRFMTPQ